MFISCRVIIFSLSLCLISCNGWKPFYGMPMRQDLLRSAPDGPPLFKQGWRDGCDSGIAATSSLFYKQFYKFTKNYDLATKSPEYEAGWSRSLWWCMRYSEFYDNVGRSGSLM